MSHAPENRVRTPCPPRSAEREIEAGSFLTFAGTIDEAGALQMEPGFCVPYRIRDAWPSPADAEGIELLTVEFLAEGGDLLHQAQLPLSPICTDPGVAGRAFAGSLTRHPDTAGLRLRIGEQILGERWSTGEGPRASLDWTPPAAGYGPVRVTWRAEVAGGDGQAALLYSNDAGASWDAVTPPMPADEGSFDLDFDVLPGGTGILRLLVTDGIQTTARDSEPFRVHRKGVALSILTPGPEARLRRGEEIWFRGQAFDVERRDAADIELDWQSSRDGPLGGGWVMARTLSIGEHEITLRAPKRADIRPASTRLVVRGGQ
jgi:hypothetical protein